MDRPAAAHIAQAAEGIEVVEPEFDNPCFAAELANTVAELAAVLAALEFAFAAAAVEPVDYFDLV